MILRPILILGLICSTILAELELPVIPTPKSVRLSSGRLPIESSTRLVVIDESLESLAKVIVDDLRRLTGEGPVITGGPDQAGDIVLRIDGRLDEEEYALDVGNQAKLSGGSLTAVAHGTSTLLQLLSTSKDSPSLPKVAIRDRPDVPFRASMLDLSRQKHDAANVRHVIDLCRFYKVRYLMLHLGDDQAWTFPSEAFPTLGEQRFNFAYKGPNFAKFTRKEFVELVDYADARGVTLIPEVDIPGHSGAMRRAAKEAFDPAGVGVVNVATQPVYDNLETLLKEVAEVFHSSPYIHFGTDEVGLGKLYETYKDDPWVKERKIKDAHELFTSFQEEMVLMIERLGRKPLAWEGHRPKKASKILKRLTWLNWGHGTYQIKDMLKDGYQVVNASFAPTYVMEGGVNATEKDVYDWDIGKSANYVGLPRYMSSVKYREVRPDQKGLIGACMCAWENPGWYEFHGLRRKLAAMSQRTWSMKSSVSWDDYLEARRKIDPLLELMIPDLDEHTPSWDLGTEEPELKVYEGFGDPELGAASGTGFESGAPWKFTDGKGRARHRARGLSYSDKKGRRLLTTDGALELSTDENSTSFSRTLAEAQAAGGGPEFWVSFLMTREGAWGGSGHWRLNQGTVDGSFGHENSTKLRHLRGSGFIDQPTQSGKTSLVVINLRPDYVSRAWLNPDLENPGAPRLLGLRQNSPTMSELIFAVGGKNKNRYIFDEFRLGNSFRAVTPVEGRDEAPEVTKPGNDLIEPIKGFEYSPFNKKLWEEREVPTDLVAWPGKKIAFLTMDDSVDPEVITRLVGRLDHGWSVYQELIGRDPNPFKQFEGLPTIAAVPEGMSCGAGCGYVGATGIELCIFYTQNYEQLRKHPDSCPHYIFYEMGRNFYVYGDKHSYFATGFAVFMRYVCMDATESEDLDLANRKLLEDFESKVASAKKMSFLEIFTNTNPEKLREHGRKSGLSSSHNSNYASVMLHLRKTYGGDEWVKRFFAVLPTADAFPVNSENAAYLQSLSWLVTASIAAGEDLAPLFTERYRLPISDQDLKRLAEVDWKKKGLKAAKVVSKLSDEPSGVESD